MNSREEPPSLDELMYRPDAVDTTKLDDLPEGFRGRVFTAFADVEGAGKQKKVGRYRHFEIWCDEPPGLGGDDEHPQPLIYLAAAVGF